MKQFLYLIGTAFLLTNQVQCSESGSVDDIGTSVIHPTWIPTTRTIPPSEIISDPQFSAHMRDFKRWFDHHELREDPRVTVIDISYPSFLMSVIRKCKYFLEHGTEQQKEGCRELVSYLNSFINTEGMAGYIENLINNTFDFVFEFARNQTPNFKARVREEFQSKARGNLTFQQRLKSLLILRKISELNLSQDFGFRRLDKISVTENRDRNIRSSLFVPHTNGSIELQLYFARYTSVLVPVNNAQESHIAEEFGILHELTHAYHHILNVFKGREDIRPLTWEFNDTKFLLNPFGLLDSFKRNIILQKLQKISIFQEPFEEEKLSILTNMLFAIFSNDKTAHENNPILKEIANRVWPEPKTEIIRAGKLKVKIVTESPARDKTEVLSLLRGLDKSSRDWKDICRFLSDKIIDKISEKWKKSWDNLEEILTIIGIAPVDLSSTERYRIIDRQNESAEMNRDIHNYRLLHHSIGALVLPGLNDKVRREWQLLQEIRKTMLQALPDIGYKLYRHTEGSSRQAQELQDRASNAMFELLPPPDEEDVLRTISGPKGNPDGSLSLAKKKSVKQGRFEGE